MTVKLKQGGEVRVIKACRFNPELHERLDGVEAAHAEHAAAKEGDEEKPKRRGRPKKSE